MQLFYNCLSPLLVCFFFKFLLFYFSITHSFWEASLILNTSTFCSKGLYLEPTDKIWDAVCICVSGGLNLTVKVPHYWDLSSGFTVLCGLPHQTAVINSLSLWHPDTTHLRHRVVIGQQLLTRTLGCVVLCWACNYQVFIFRYFSSLIHLIKYILLHV